MFKGEPVHRIAAELHTRIRTRLYEIDTAVTVDSLRLPPGNRLARLHGEREGQWSIRVNRQWRISFVWEGSDAYEVEIVDYH